MLDAASGTDVVMAGMNGRALADRVAEVHPEIPVLFATGYTADVALRKDLLKGGARVIHKPFTTASLVAKVSEALGAGPRGPTP